MSKISNTRWCDHPNILGECYRANPSPEAMSANGNCQRCGLSINTITREFYSRAPARASGPGHVRRVKIIRRRDLVADRNTLYVFGDNMQRAGRGGQAREMRGEPNAVGIPTKWEPANRETSYFKNTDLDNHEVRAAIHNALDRLQEHLDNGGDVVIPTDGVGTGLAGLDRHAPLIYRLIEKRLSELDAKYP